MLKYFETSLPDCNFESMSHGNPQISILWVEIAERLSNFGSALIESFTRSADRNI